MGWRDRFRKGKDRTGEQDASDRDDRTFDYDAVDAPGVVEDEVPVAAGGAAALLELAKAGAPLADQRRALADFYRANGVSKEAVQALLARTRDGIALVADGDASGTSRLGGQPLLPAGEAWPHAPDGRPLSFVAALDFAELPELEPLPRRGTLLVYWYDECHELDPTDLVAATRVFYVKAGDETQRHGAPDADKAFGPVALTGAVMPLPGSSSGADLPGANDDALYAAQDELLTLGLHQLLGDSRDVQGPVLEEVSYWFEQGDPKTRERYSVAEQQGEGWLLLAQIEEVDGLYFGDAGSLYLVMPEGDLRARRFDRVMGIMQCG